RPLVSLPTTCSPALADSPIFFVSYILTFARPLRLRLSLPLNARRTPMSTGKLRVVHDPDRHELTVQLAQGTDIQSAPPVAFSNPLSLADRAELRWYLEDYLRFPIGIYPDRALRVEEKMAGWGGAMFDALFGAGKARDFYVLLKDRGLKKFGF